MFAAAKAIGALLAVLGVLALLAGLAAAAYALYDAEAHRGDLVRDSGRDGRNQSVLTAGAATAAGGLVLFLAGLVTLVASRSPGGTPAGAAPKAPKAEGASAPARPPPSRAAALSQPRNAALAGTVAVLLVALLLGAAYLASTGGAGDLFGGSADVPARTVLDLKSNGTVQRGSLGLPGVPDVDASDNTGEFTPPRDARTCTATLDWDPDVAAGAAELSLNVTRNGARAAAHAGGPGFTAVLDPQGMAGAPHRFVVTAPAGPFVSQPFHLRVVCLA